MSDFFGTGAIFDFGSGSVGITFSSTSSISSDATKMAQGSSDARATSWAAQIQWNAWVFKSKFNNYKFD